MVQVKETDEARLLPQLELLQSLAPVVEQQLSLLLPIAEAWQPTDFLPDLAGSDWRDQMNLFRAEARPLSDDILVVLVGDMVTEEALPNYAISLNLIAQDYVGASPSPWARWMRGWTAEENRHGDLLNAYLRLTGRVDMRAVEVTVHHLIAGGFNPPSYPDLYAGLIYTSFQERATKISHARVGALAAAQGAEGLGRICRKIAGDEARHEAFYTTLMGAVMQRDPERAVRVFKDLMRRLISMPGQRMSDGQDPDLFEHFAIVAQRLGVYTALDYAGILQHLLNTWQVSTLAVTGEAAAAQEYLCVQAQRLEGMAEGMMNRIAQETPKSFSWIHGRVA